MDRSDLRALESPHAYPEPEKHTHLGRTLRDSLPWHPRQLHRQERRHQGHRSPGSLAILDVAWCLPLAVRLQAGRPGTQSLGRLRRKLLGTKLLQRGTSEHPSSRHDTWSAFLAMGFTACMPCKAIPGAARPKGSPFLAATSLLRQRQGFQLSETSHTGQLPQAEALLAQTGARCPRKSSTSLSQPFPQPLPPATPCLASSQKRRLKLQAFL